MREFKLSHDLGGKPLPNSDAPGPAGLWPVGFGVPIARFASALFEKESGVASWVDYQKIRCTGLIAVTHRNYRFKGVQEKLKAGGSRCHYPYVATIPSCTKLLGLGREKSAEPFFLNSYFVSPIWAAVGKSL